MPIEPEIVRKARQKDLYSFLASRGEKFKKSGKRWQHIEHDSLIISGNMFYWNSRQAKGNSLDFVMLYYGWSFEQAIQELTDLDKNIEQQKPRRQEIDDGYITQDEKGNAVFKVYNEYKELVGAEIVGTLSQVRFKRIAEGSQVGYGFNVTIGEPTKTLFFESSIDLLSFWTLHENNLTAHRLVSLSGLRLDILKNTLEKFQIAIKNAYLCVDIDNAGKAFINAVKNIYQNIKTYLPKTGKDWNDQLRAQSRSKNDHGTTLGKEYRRDKGREEI